MTTSVSPTRSDVKLKKQLTEQGAQIGKLRSRINELVDDIAVLQNDVNMFKKNVSKDLLDVIETLKDNISRS